MDLGIEGRVALVTGGGRGIGRAIAERLAAEACRVAVADIDEPALAHLPSGVLGLACDVTSQAQLEDALGTVRRELGAIEILINNAGICVPESVPETTMDNWERTLRVNLTSAFTLCKLLLPEMKGRGWGRIVNISSMAGKIGGLTSGVAYTAAKAGMLGLTKSVAREGAPQVTCNAVAPAFIETDMTPAEVGRLYADSIPVKRLGTAQEVAAAVAFLASDLAGYITGEVLDINGGLLMD
jgi:3-oxoacyl-[acyl-carrier protein] reductase